jgi:ATP-dependent Clp protease protease subunit
MNKLEKLAKILQFIPKLSKKSSQELPTPSDLPPQSNQEEGIEELQELIASLKSSDSESDTLASRGILFLNSPIMGCTVQPLIQQMWAYHFSNRFNDPVQLIIDSPGGEIGAGWALIDTMQAIRLPVATIAVGDVFSMAAMIFVTGDYRMITPHSKTMIHHFSRHASGNYPSLLADRKLDEMEYRKFIAHFVKHSKYRSEKQILKHILLEQDNFLSPEEMITHGLADEIFRPKKKKIKRC